MSGQLGESARLLSRLLLASANLQDVACFTAHWIPIPGPVRRRMGFRGSSPADRCQSAISSKDHVPARLVSAKIRSPSVPIWPASFAEGGRTESTMT